MEIRYFGNYRGAALYLLLHFNDEECYLASVFVIIIKAHTGQQHPPWNPGDPLFLLTNTQSPCSPKQKAELAKGRGQPHAGLHVSNPRPCPLWAVSLEAWSVLMPQEGIFRVKRVRMWDSVVSSFPAPFPAATPPPPPGFPETWVISVTG